MPTIDELTQWLELLKPWLPYIASLGSGVYTTIVFIYNSRRSARKEALDAANAQIALQSISFDGLQQKYDALLKRFDEEHRDRIEEQDRAADQMRKLKDTVSVWQRKFAVALAHIQKLQGVMQECGIAAPPMPPELTS